MTFSCPWWMLESYYCVLDFIHVEEQLQVDVQAKFSFQELHKSRGGSRAGQWEQSSDQQGKRGKSHLSVFTAHSQGRTDFLTEISTSASPNNHVHFFFRDATWPQKKCLVMRALLSKASSSIWNIQGSMRPCSRAFGTSCRQSLKGEKLQSSAALVIVCV